MILIYILVTWFCKLLTLVLKITGQGRGTALPGLIIEKYFPFLIPYILNKLPYTILITGTNGKTTTRTLISHILKEEGTVIENRSGSNLIRGIISEIVLQSNVLGGLDVNYAVFEVEEATIPKLTKLLKPKQIIVTNLYRDQLDAYGELDRTKSFIQKAIKMSPESHLILNGDDPLLVNLTTDLNQTTSFFQIDDKLKTKFDYEGKATSSKKDNSIIAKSLKINNDLTTSFIVENTKINLRLPGYYNVYNALATITCTKILGLSYSKIISAIEQTKPAFGRGEIINYKGKKLQILLVKNLAGMNLSLDLLSNIDNSEIVFILNDRKADGRDVSWIWDSNFELLNRINPRAIICSGTRANDLLNRIKYALNGLENTNVVDKFYKKNTHLPVLIHYDIEDTIKYFEKSSNSTIYILATYTAMLELRKRITGNSLNV